MDDVIVARPFETAPRIFDVWLKQFDATFVIAASILILPASVIYVAYRHRHNRVLLEVQTIVFHDLSDVPRNTEEC